MSDVKSGVSFVRVVGMLAVMGTATAGIATFSESVATILRNGREVVLNVVQGQKRVSFEIKALEPRFAVLGTMTGEATIEKPFLRARVSTGTLQTKKDSLGVPVSYVRLGLAHLEEPPGRWGVEAWSEKKKLRQTVESFSTVNIEPFEVVIPIDQVQALEGHWLVLEIGLDDEGKQTTYMHSSLMMFTR